MQYVVMNNLVTQNTEFGKFTTLKAAKEAIAGMECKTILKVTKNGVNVVYRV